MIIGALVEHAAPEHPAGAEWTLQDTFSWLAARGHDCRIVSTRGYKQERISGVLVFSNPTDEEVARHFQECDVMLTQLGGVAWAQVLAMTYQTPLVHVIHSATQLEALGVMPECSALVVFNSWHVAVEADWWPGGSMVLHPPIDAERVRVEQPGQLVVLVNTSHNKGGPDLYRLAMRMERTPFLGVQGAYGEQTMGPDGMPGTGANPVPTGLPVNMRVSPPVLDIKDVLRLARVLLVLSQSETYGRVAGEAIISGIPVIAARTPGLVECLGGAGVYLDHRHDDKHLERLVQQAYTPAWDEWSNQSAARGLVNAARQEKELKMLERHLRRIKRDAPAIVLP